MEYMDHNATTPLAPEVWEAMVPYWTTYFANASSLHSLGAQQRRVIEQARERIAGIIGVEASQVLFTSSGTEANNLFIHGASEWQTPKTIWTSPYEHPCVLEPAKALIRKQWTHLQLEGNADGSLQLDKWLPEPKSLKGCLVSVMMANNETGVILPVSTIAQRAKAAGAWVHSDAVQALGKIPVNMSTLGVDALTLSGHKIYGPKGVGALIVSKRLDLRPLLLGGGHERGYRSGTEAVPLIVGFAVAVERAEQKRQEWVAHVEPLRQRLEEGLKALGAILFGERSPRIANTTYFGFEGIHGDSWVRVLDEEGFAVSSGSACSSQHPGPSKVLQAMGYLPLAAESAVRISLGWQNTLHSIEILLMRIKQALIRFRSMPGLNVL